MLIRCPMCGWERRVKDDLEGRDGQCRRCGEQFTLTAIAELPNVAPIIVETAPPIVVKSQAVTTFVEEKPHAKKVAMIAVGVAVLLATHAGALLVGSAAGNSKVTSLKRELEASRQEVRDLGVKVAAGRSFIPITREEIAEGLVKEFPEFRVTEKSNTTPEGRSVTQFTVGLHSVTVLGFGDAVDEVRTLVGFSEGDTRVPARVAAAVGATISPKWTHDERTDWIIRAVGCSAAHNVIGTITQGAVRWELDVVTVEDGQLVILNCYPTSRI